MASLRDPAGSVGLAGGPMPTTCYGNVIDDLSGSLAGNNNDVVAMMMTKEYIVVRQHDY